MDNEENVLMSRPISNSIGKCTEEMKLHLPEEAVDALAYLAMSNGKTKGEYTRNVILEHLFGAAVIAQLKQEQGK